MFAVSALDGSAAVLKDSSYRCCRLSRLIKNVEDVSKYLPFLYVRMNARIACVFQSPWLKCLAECHPEVTDAMPSLEGDCSLSGLTSPECYLWHAHTQKRALTLLSCTQLHQSISTQTNRISWPPIHFHQTFSDTSLSESHFFFLVYRCRGRRSRGRRR